MQRGALTQQDAAAWLSLSVNTFKRHVRPHLRALYVGGVVRYPVAELQRFIDKSIDL